MGQEESAPNRRRGDGSPDGDDVDEVVIEFEFDESEFDSDDDELDDEDGDDADSFDPDRDDLVRDDRHDGTLIVEVDGDRVSYEASDWSGASRALLDAMIGSEGLTHSWQGARLTISLSDRERVEELIDEVLATAVPALDTDRAKIVYEVGGWSAGMQTSLAESLVVADVPYEWNEAGDLVVYGDDEEMVDQILDAMPDPDDAERAEVDGLEVQELLSALFVASGELARRPRDADAVIALDEHGTELENMGVPFGFEPPVWEALVARVVRLREALDPGDDGDELGDDELSGLARELRDELRRYV